MCSEALKSDNLVKLLDGLSLLDDRDQDRIIGMIDSLDCERVTSLQNADKNVKGAVFSDTSLLNTEILSANTGDKI